MSKIMKVNRGSNTNQYSGYVKKPVLNKPVKKQITESIFDTYLTTAIEDLNTIASQIMMKR